MPSSWGIVMRFGRSAIGIIAALSAALTMAASAQAEWLQASSPHFIVYGNVSPKEMAQFADRLARFDAAIRKVVPTQAGEPGTSDKLTIYMVESVSGVQRLYDGNKKSIAGFYRATAAGAFAVTPRTTDDADFTQQVLFHEYVHHVTLGATHGYYPGWMAEGMAEFLGTARIMPDGAVRIGIPDNARAYSILSDTPMSVATLLSEREFKSDELIDQKYARAWLLVHYLTIGQPKGGELNDYVRLINQGVAQAEAATKAFGDLGDLNTALNRYRMGKFHGADLTPAMLKIDPVTIRKLDNGEAAMMPIRIRSATGVDDREAKQLVAPARRVAADYPQHAWVQRALAEIEYDAGNDAAAEAACDAALAVKPTDVDALMYKGRVHVRRLAADKTATPAQWREARGWFLKANRIDHDLPVAFEAFYDSFAIAHEQPSDNAVKGLAYAAALVPQDDNLRFKLTMAMIRKGDLKAARDALRPLAYRPHLGADSVPRKLLALLDSSTDAAAVQVAADAMMSKAQTGGAE